MNLQHLLFAALKSRNDEDMIDKVNNKLTSYLMFALGLSIFAQEYTGDPVKCWEKPSWFHTWIEYAEDYCFIEGTYAIKLNASLPNPGEIDHHKKVAFYQWIPFIFYLMGIILQLPRFFWSFVNWTSYLHLTGFCNVAVENFRKNVVHKGKDSIEAYVSHFEDAIQRKCQKSFVKKPLLSVKGTVGLWNNHVSSKYLYVSYLFLKLWQIGNNILLFILLNRLIADEWDSDIFGFATFSKVWSYKWTDTDIFPRITVCQFYIREMGKSEQTELASKTVQCVLSAHLFVETFFLVVWIWLAALLVLNVYALVAWCIRIFNCTADGFLKEYIVSGIEFVDFMKHENERRRKEAEAKEKEGVKLMEHFQALKAQNDSKNGGGDESSSRKADNQDNNKKKPIDKTILDMEGLFPKKESDSEKEMADIEKSLKQLMKPSNKMSESQKKEFISKQKQFYEKNVDTCLSAFRKNLGLDGLLTLYMIAINASSIAAARIISQFFFDFIVKIQDKQTQVHDFPPKYDGFKKEKGKAGLPFDLTDF